MQIWTIGYSLTLPWVADRFYFFKWPILTETVIRIVECAQKNERTISTPQKRPSQIDSDARCFYFLIRIAILLSQISTNGESPDRQGFSIDGNKHERKTTTSSRERPLQDLRKSFLP